MSDHCIVVELHIHQFFTAVHITVCPQAEVEVPNSAHHYGLGLEQEDAENEPDWPYHQQVYYPVHELENRRRYLYNNVERPEEHLKSRFHTFASYPR